MRDDDRDLLPGGSASRWFRGGPSARGASLILMTTISTSLLCAGVMVG
jgi:hypothetical protein